MIGMTLEEALIQGAAMRGGGGPAPITTVKAWFESLQLCDTLQLSTLVAGLSGYTVQIRVGAAYGGGFVPSQTYQQVTSGNNLYAYRYSTGDPSKQIWLGLYKSSKLLYVHDVYSEISSCSVSWNYTKNDSGVYAYRYTAWDWRYDSERSAALTRTSLMPTQVDARISIPFIHISTEYKYIFHDDAPPTPNGTETYEGEDTDFYKATFTLPNVAGGNWYNYCFSDMSESDLMDENEAIVKILCQATLGQTPTIIDPIN